MTRWPHECNEHELEKTLGDGKGQRGLECCSSWGCKESDITEQLDNKNRINNPKMSTEPCTYKKTQQIGQSNLEKEQN